MQIKNDMPQNRQVLFFSDESDPEYDRLITPYQDKNGKQIVKGDLVQYDHALRPDGKPALLSERIMTVFYCEKRRRFGVKDNEYDWLAPLWLIHSNVMVCN